MKRIHVHIAVENLDESIRFYTAVLGSKPSILKSDYAKWLLDDPRVNFAVSKRGHGAGLSHLGIQVESSDELKSGRDAAVAQKTACCC